MLSLALGVTPLNPHGYWPISSECASTESFTVRAAPGLVSLRPNSAAAPPVGDEVGALDLQPGRVRQVVAGVAPAARELRRRPDPLAVDPEPHAVDELERRRPDAAHLARDMPAVGVEPAVLEADRVGPRPGGHLAAVLEPARRRQLRRGRLRRPSRDQHRNGPDPDRTRYAHDIHLLGVPLSPAPKSASATRSTRGHDSSNVVQRPASKERIQARRMTGDPGAHRSTRKPPPARAATVAPHRPSPPHPPNRAASGGHAANRSLRASNCRLPRAVKPALSSGFEPTGMGVELDGHR